MLIDKDLRLDISDCFWLLYASKYIVKNDELKHLRIFITDYTLSEDGSVATVTIQYQLY